MDEVTRQDYAPDLIGVLLGLALGLAIGGIGATFARANWLAVGLIESACVVTVVVCILGFRATWLRDHQG